MTRNASAAAKRFDARVIFRLQARCAPWTARGVRSRRKRTTSERSLSRSRGPVATSSSSPSSSGCLQRVASLALAIVLAACGPRTRRTPDDALVYVLELQVRELDPRYTMTNHEVKISRLVATALVSVDQPSLQPKLELAESVDLVDPLTWVVTVRSTARFPDGSPLTARDVAFSFKSAMADPKSPQYHVFNERLADVDV